MKEGTAHLSTPITSINRLSNGTIELSSGNEDKLIFDHVILATHADTSISIIDEHLSTNEKDILSNFTFSNNEAVLHYDEMVCSLFHALNYN